MGFIGTAEGFLIPTWLGVFLLQEEVMMMVQLQFVRRQRYLNLANKRGETGKLMDFSS